MANEEKIVREYVGKAGAGFIPGVPARDLTPEDWRGLTAPQKKDVDGLGLYRKVGAEDEPASKPKTETASQPSEDKEG